MIIFQEISAYFVLMCLAYLVGSINFSIIIFRLVRNDDIRNFGSKNAGATNLGRKLGMKAAILIVILDLLKTVSVIFTSITLVESVEWFKKCETWLPLVGIMVIIGHCYPVFFDFRGGKGVACALGIWLSFNWVIGLIAIALTFTIVFLIKYVSLASLTTSWTMFILSWVPWFSHGPEATYYFSNNYYVTPLVLGVVALIIMYQHRVNIIRLISKTESKTYLFKFQNKNKE